MLLVAVLGLLVGLSGAPGNRAEAQAPEQRSIMPLAEVRAGMKGTGLTVIRGTRVEPFDVEILGVVPNAGPVGDLILVRVGGPLIEETGGIAAGMSGSPVYVGGRLIGAVSYGFSFSDHRVGFLTPIERMLDVLALARARGESATKPGESAEETLPEVITARPDGSLALPPATPLATPLLVSGASERVFRRLQNLVEPLGYRVELGGRLPTSAGPKGAESTDAAPGQLVPGSAFGAALVTGDLSVTAIGTVTYTEDDYFVGFGHPFLNKGRVELPVSLAEIYQTVRSQEAPFKLGAPRQFAGMLLEDRPAGVAGKLAVRAPGIEVKVNVEDLDRREKTTFTAMVAPDEVLATNLVALAALQAMDRGLTRIGRGTAEVRLTMRGDGLPGGAVTRENTFYSPADIAATALRDLVSGVALVTRNPFRPVSLRQVELSARVGEERRTGVIEKVRLIPDRPVKPGESAELEVLIRPYRGEVRRERILLPVPADFPAGRFVVAVRGGGTAAAGEEEEESLPADGGHPPNPEKPAKGPDKIQEPKTNAESFEALIDQFVRRDRNHELVAELVRAGENGEDAQGEPVSEPAKPPGHPPARRTGKAPAVQSNHQERSNPKARLALPYVVLGGAEVQIEIGPGGTTEPPLKPPPAPRWERPRRDP
ncbi:MAG: SpoIVB peptidase S55 domain-containing protein [Bacillota bacterium]|nr:SpoIVB peptidase S55 domain-containing protein [Bacillota bacterium]